MLVSRTCYLVLCLCSTRVSVALRMICHMLPMMMSLNAGLKMTPTVILSQKVSDLLEAFDLSQASHQVLGAFDRSQASNQLVPRHRGEAEDDGVSHSVCLTPTLIPLLHKSQQTDEISAARSVASGFQGDTNGIGTKNLFTYLEGPGFVRAQSVLTS